MPTMMSMRNSRYEAVRKGQPHYTCSQPYLIYGMANRKSYIWKKRQSIILSRVRSGSTNADTYYQYDDKDRIIRVIPPGASASSTDLIYTYEYDAADRLVKKKVPGMG